MQTSKQEKFGIFALFPNNVIISFLTENSKIKIRNTWQKIKEVVEKSCPKNDNKYNSYHHQKYFFMQTLCINGPYLLSE